MKSILLSLLFSTSFAFAADVTLEPNGKEVNINGTTVVCAPDTYLSGIRNATDEVVVGMATAGKLGACTVRVDELDGSRVYSIYLSTKSDIAKVADYTSQASTATALRGYVAAGACRQ